MILIDREKPKSCGRCWYDKICKRWRTQDWGCPPPTDCPLKELPPHGDLIDREFLIEMYQDGFFTGLTDADICTAPTVIPAEPADEEEKNDCTTCKHGHYNDYFGTSFCYSGENCENWNLWEPKEVEI